MCWQNDLKKRTQQLEDLRRQHAMLKDMLEQQEQVTLLLTEFVSLT